MSSMSEPLQYLTNKSGEKTAVVLSLSDYEKLMEDLEDLAVVAERRDEPTLSHEQFKAELKRDGLL
jgi:prevent-host-death family protein